MHWVTGVSSTIQKLFDPLYSWVLFVLPASLLAPSTYVTTLCFFQHQMGVYF